ncbi:C4-dicarboxylate transporter DctA [Pedobacter miscanthi]|uniref:Glutamate/aspartate:proton symporter GltP n=1 Tax=Pedobacter miscanthi TaxID=2259170 RepID=A0A366LDC5_9SPHI|nr:C4-dicarboxylate transporter DctA [Pedobacter miscanthi]RBQ11881.1 glutamate/aspartate:proton symporter GltP [Pedobacter miscanthi]
MRYLKTLYVQVLIAIVLGVIVGYLYPSFAPSAKLISDTFINMIKMIIAPVIFLSIVIGIAKAGDIKKVGKMGLKAIVYFEIITTIAIIIGLVIANIIKPGEGVEKPVTAAAQAVHGAEIDWKEFIAHIVPGNIVEAFAKGEIVQVLFFGVLFAVALSKMKSAGDSVIAGFEKINQVLFNILHIVIKVSPLGAFGGMAYTIGKFGFATLAVLGKLLITFYITGAAFIFIVLYLVLKANGFSLWKLLKYIKSELLIVLGSSSSEAVLPNIMEKLEAAGCEKSVVGLVVPAGYSFNLDGTSIYLSLAVVFLAQLFHVNLTLGQEITIIGILMLTSKGAAGVTGSGFLVLTSTLTALKIIPLEGLALLVGVDRFMSEGRAIINVIGNTIATLVIAKSEKLIDVQKYLATVENPEKK